MVQIIANIKFQEFSKIKSLIEKRCPAKFKQTYESILGTDLGDLVNNVNVNVTVLKSCDKNHFYMNNRRL